MGTDRIRLQSSLDTKYQYIYYNVLLSKLYIKLHWLYPSPVQLHVVPGVCVPGDHQSPGVPVGCHHSYHHHLPVQVHVPGVPPVASYWTGSRGPDYGHLGSSLSTYYCSTITFNLGTGISSFTNVN